MLAPQTASDPVLARLADQVRDAVSRRAVLELRGGGTKSFYGNPPRGEPMDLRPLTGISNYEPTELVVTVRAGTPLAELEATLAERGQFLPFDPPQFGVGGTHGTVGGMVAAGLSGPSRAAVGSVRDHVLGVTLLNGQSEVLTFGGQVMKNVAGYDVSRVIAGSLGVLGVLCEVSLKVLPLPASMQTVQFDCEEAHALRLLNEWGGQPLPINASAWFDGRLRVRLAGADAAVRAAHARIGGEVVAHNEAAEWWDGVRDHRHSFFALDEADLASGENLWRLSLPSVAARSTLAGAVFVEWGGAQRWLRSRAVAAEVRAAAATVGGHATLFRSADKSGGAFAPLAEPLMRIHRGLKKAFDPAGVFNPGRLYPEL